MLFKKNSNFIKTLKVKTYFLGKLKLLNYILITFFFKHLYLLKFIFFFILDLTLLSCFTGKVKKTSKSDKKVKKNAPLALNARIKTQSPLKVMQTQASVNKFQESDNDMSNYTSSDSGNYSIIQNISVFL